MEPEIICIPSAFKHGISEENIRWAVVHPRYEGPVEDGENRYIVLGFDRAGNLLEIMYNRLNEKKVKVFHAMKCRNIFFGLLDE
ncbi:hypothetical protein AGMMS49579_18510 [Spirochaetia bacterium]|nr:hypothetical protein AGMMS49579_18510 [Spirochaetia bacterium]